MVKRKKKSSGSDDGSGHDLRNLGIMNASASGKTQSEIADEFGLSRQRVNSILNSDEAKRLTDQARSHLQSILSEAVNTIEEALVLRHGDMRTAVNAALAVLKGTGVLKEKIEHTVLKPFVLELLDGKEIVMGHKQEASDNEERS